MPLSAPVEREPMHRRVVECRGFRRKDGLWDIEGHITDTKAYSFKNQFRGEIRAGEPLHEMWIRLTIDEDRLVHAIEAVTDHGPFRVCPDITPKFQALKGLRIGPGWTKAIRDRLGGVQGCTHLVELLGPVATTAYQTLVAARRAQQEAAPQKRPWIIDTCHAWAADGDAVRYRYPNFYTGTKETPAG